MDSSGQTLVDDEDVSATERLIRNVCALGRRCRTAPPCGREAPPQAHALTSAPGREWGIPVSRAAPGRAHGRGAGSIRPGLRDDPVVGGSVGPFSGQAGWGGGSYGAGRRSEGPWRGEPRTRPVVCRDFSSPCSRGISIPARRRLPAPTTVGDAAPRLRPLDAGDAVRKDPGLGWLAHAKTAGERCFAGYDGLQVSSSQRPWRSDSLAR